MEGDVDGDGVDRRERPGRPKVTAVETRARRLRTTHPTRARWRDRPARRSVTTAGSTREVAVGSGHRGEESLGVLGGRLANRLVDAAALDDPPSRITTTSSARSATTPMSCVISRIASAESVAQLAQQVEDAGLHGDVQRGGRLVGDQQRPGRTLIAIAIIARCS